MVPVISIQGAGSLRPSPPRVVDSATKQAGAAAAPTTADVSPGHRFATICDQRGRGFRPLASRAEFIIQGMRKHGIGLRPTARWAALLFALLVAAGPSSQYRPSQSTCSTHRSLRAQRDRQSNAASTWVAAPAAHATGDPATEQDNPQPPGRDINGVPLQQSRPSGDPPNVSEPALWASRLKRARRLFPAHPEAPQPSPPEPPPRPQRPTTSPSSRQES